MYHPILKKILFSFPPETAHVIALKTLKFLHALHLIPSQTFSAPCNIMGLQFTNPIGLAAGLDKNGDYIDALAALGFGFIEIGTVTPKPQQGNPKPRLFRLTEQEAIINRMGFNNKGVEYLVEKVKKAKFRGILGINIGKNRDTSLEKARDDYLFCFKRVAPIASFVTINLSSPNTPSLRDLQHGELFSQLLKDLKFEQSQQKKYVPLVVKISPDLSKTELVALAHTLLIEKMDGIIATNTTIQHAGETGGLSGKPLFVRSTQIVSELHAILKDQIPIIACGGIFSKEDVQTKMAAGAALVQLYSGFIYRGPTLLKEIFQTQLNPTSKISDVL